MQLKLARRKYCLIKSSQLGTIFVPATGNWNKSGPFVFAQISEISEYDDLMTVYGIRTRNLVDNNSTIKLMAALTQTGDYQLHWPWPCFIWPNRKTLFVSNMDKAAYGSLCMA